MKQLTDDEILAYVRENWGKMTSAEMREALKGIASRTRLQAARGIVYHEKKASQISDDECADYILAHWENLSDKQMAKALGTYTDRIKKLRLEMGLKKRNYRVSGMLCWACAKATSLYRCRYVRSCIGRQDVKYYEGTEVVNGRIVSCPEFKADDK